jgi:hypothetical protein
LVQLNGSQPLLDFVVLVGAVVVADDVEFPAGIGGSDLLKELQRLVR